MDISTIFTGKEKDGKEYKDGPLWLTNSHSWVELSRHLSESGHPKLQSLAKHGKATDTNDIAEGLVELAEQENLTPEQLALIETLVTRIGEGDKEETLVITDGQNF